MEADLDVTDLARIMDTIQFPGLPQWDLLVPHEHGEVLIRTTDSDAEGGGHPLLQFRYDPRKRTFADPHDLYPLLHEARKYMRTGELDSTVPVAGLGTADAAVLCARFPFTPHGTPEQWNHDPALPAAFHRLLLTQILTGQYAGRGLEVLRRGGYLAQVLPELARMEGTDQSKEGHPEGDVWRHTVETLRYRKKPDLRVSLALLLHDTGKPLARSRGGHRFADHADIGATVARDVLKRLAFSEQVIRDVVWLIRFHMMPGALERMPDHRRDPIMASDLFPLLLEVYRCDLSSTYRGPEGYYRACTVYRRFQKRQRRGAAAR